MNAARLCLPIWCSFVVLVSIGAKAAFDGPYEVIPPTPGVYQSFSFNFTYTFGSWTASGARMTINTMNAPTRIDLAVPAVSATGSSLRFEVRAPADGTVSFDSAAESIAPGHVNWFQQVAGGAFKSVALDGGLGGQVLHFSFAVQAGETFGFTLLGGGDVSTPGAPLANTLTVENFTAPIPEPSALVLLTMGITLLARFRGGGFAQIERNVLQ